MEMKIVKIIQALLPNVMKILDYRVIIKMNKRNIIRNRINDKYNHII